MSQHANQPEGRFSVADGPDPALLPLRLRPSTPSPKPLSASQRVPTFPKVGDTLFGFRLRQELGRGAFACVFLAEQADLAGPWC
jgi:hypothetical protein